MSAETKPVHSKIGASSMDRWSKCPGSVRLSEGMPSFTSKYAEEGTQAHEYAAKWLETGIDPTPDDYPEDDREAIETYVNFLKDRWAALPRHESSKWLIEHKFDLTEVYPNLYGTGDSVMFDGANKVLYVDDLKFGKGIPVDAEKNPQLMYYGVGALYSLKLPVEKIVLTIIQPRYSSDIKEAIKSCVVSPVDMMDFIADLKDFAKATENTNAPIVEGDHCQFCKAVPVCPAKKADANFAMEKAFGAPAEVDITLDQVKYYLDKVERVELWCKSIRELAYAMSQTEKIPGYKRVAKQARRKWNDPVKAQQSIELMFTDNVVRECLTDPKLKTPAQVEKVLGKSSKDLIETLASAVSSGDVLVPESDKRPELTSAMKAEIAFGYIKEE